MTPEQLSEEIDNADLIIKLKPKDREVMWIMQGLMKLKEDYAAIYAKRNDDVFDRPEEDREPLKEYRQQAGDIALGIDALMKRVAQAFVEAL